MSKQIQHSLKIKWQKRFRTLTSVMSTGAGRFLRSINRPLGLLNDLKWNIGTVVIEANRSKNKEWLGFSSVYSIIIYKTIQQLIMIC